MPRFTYATRRSSLALAQCRAFIERLKAVHSSAEPIELQVTTSGDRIVDRPLAEVGGKGLFVKEIEEALLDGRADLAVHSMKDLPAELPPALVIACVPVREDARDVLVAPRHGTLANLPTGATVGTSSLRRAISLRYARPDLTIVPLRGNVDTRLRKVDAGACNAIVLARAGLVRLGLAARVTELLEVDVSLPAVGQGALGIECRRNDVAMRAMLAPLHDLETATCVAAERAVMVALRADCRTPLGAHARRVLSGGADDLVLEAFVSSPDGARVRRGVRAIAWPQSEQAAYRVGLELGTALLRG